MTGFTYTIDEAGARVTSSVPKGWSRTTTAGRFGRMAAVSDPTRRRLRAAHRRARPGLQRGTFLLEALIAALVFSFGSLAMVGLQARAVRHANDAQYRGEAAQLAQAVLAEMGATDVATLATRFDARSGGAGYTALLDRAKNLPGVSATQNSPDILVDRVLRR